MGKRVMNILKHIFPVPKLDAKRIVTFSNESDYISFRYTSFLRNKLSSRKLCLHVLFCVVSCLKILMGAYIYIGTMCMIKEKEARNR